MNNKKTGKKNYLRVARKVLSLLLALNLTTSVSFAKEQKQDGLDHQTQYCQEELDETQTYLKKYGIETSKLKCGTIYVNSYTKEGVKNLIVYDNEEFKQYLEYKNPTFEDCTEILNYNENISMDFKIKISNYLNKIKKTNRDADLIVFYTNLIDLKIECISKEEMDEVGTNIIARFDAKNHKIVYLTEMSEKVFEHELSHLFTDCYLYLDEETLVHKTLSLAIPLIEEKKITIQFSLSAALEGITDLFTSSNNSYNYKYGSYEDFVNEIIELLNLTNENILSIQENGIIYFLDKLYEYGIQNPFDLLYEMDQEFYDLLNKTPKLTKSA